MDFSDKGDDSPEIRNWFCLALGRGLEGGVFLYGALLLLDLPLNMTC
jgi:hypothetical protein